MIGKNKVRMAFSISDEAKKMFDELAEMDKKKHKKEKKKGPFYSSETLETLIRNEYTIRKTFGRK